jgi:hypothetical protein
MIINVFDKENQDVIWIREVHHGIVKREMTLEELLETLKGFGKVEIKNEK